VEPIQGPPQKGLRLAARLIVARVRFQDLDCLGCTAITDVHLTGEYPERAGHQLRDLRIAPTAERAAHCSPKHVHTSDSNLKIR
jgi:hypothetical protein